MAPAAPGARKATTSSVARLVARLRRRWAQLRGWRRIRFTAAGALFTAGAFAVGFAAINTGNNLLYLLLGAMLGLVALSGWLSEQAIRGLEVERRTPPGTPVDRDVRILYYVRNRKTRIPSLAVELIEEGLEGRAFLVKIPPRSSANAVGSNRFVRRGVYPLDTVTVSTTFPFGLFRKERDVSLPGELVIWPRSDRPVRTPTPGGGHRERRAGTPAGATGHRGEYRSLREYRPGDAPRDIHWRRSARLETPVVREYEQEGAESFWICLDTGAEPGNEAEAAVELAASLAARAVEGERRFGLVAGDARTPPGSGPGHLEDALDRLARADFDPGHPLPAPPADPARCVLVSATGSGAGRFGDALVTGDSG